jgi:hypothetical protein
VYGSQEEFAMMRRYSPGMPIAVDDTSETPYADWAIETQRQSRVSPLLWNRLMQQRRLVPEDADIFLKFQVPFEPPFYPNTEADEKAIAAMGADDQTSVSNREKYAMMRECAQINSSKKLLGDMTNLTRLNQHRHFIVPYFSFFECDERFTMNQRAMKLAYRFQLDLETDGLSITRINDRPSLSELHVPYIGNVRWRRAWEERGATPPWRSSPYRRKYLGARAPSKLCPTDPFPALPGPAPPCRILQHPSCSVAATPPLCRCHVAPMH